ncbi:MAG: CerR family C-terminal domain-containing protein [Isosphaeraceae bacterium]|nr:CerR family C-terminal domain-containing protein [Isosphaeraceae bacterium]
MEFDTKKRLLAAASEEFAEKGFEGATVRSISYRAGTNLAAVNYHFGDKTKLYEEVLLEAHRCESFDLDEETHADAHPAERLRAYIRGFVFGVFGTDAHRNRHRALMLREMLEPTSASDLLVREAIGPRFARLRSILHELTPAADDQRLHALVFSIVGQILHYKFARAISERLIGAEAYARLDVDYISDHIARFTLAALGVEPPIVATETPDDLLIPAGPSAEESS